MPLRSPPFRVARHLFLFPVAVSSPFSPPRRIQLACMSSLAASNPAEDGCGGVGVRAKRGRLRGLVFDMDGTLTVPVIDFGAMYRAVLGEEGYASYRAARASVGGVDILHHIESWAPPEQQRAYEIIAHFERQGLDRLQIMPDASSDAFVGLFALQSQATVPYLNRTLSNSLVSYQVVCGKRAGAFTCLLDETGRYGSPDSYTDDIRPDFKVSSLSEVLSLLETHFDLMPEPQMT
ncbi:hypothetical protein BHM03_00053505 [Ensete ventricosum]|nr:hypothetical protein BHM03_00053505 [Ensete ventricosum]